MGGVEGVEVSGPTEDAVVGGDEAMALEGGGDDYAVGGVAVEVFEEGGSHRNEAIDGNLNQPDLKEILAPVAERLSQADLTLLQPHADFPEGNGGCCRSLPFECKGDFSYSPPTEAPVSVFEPDHDVGIEEYQKSSFREWSGSSNHSAGMGETMSPRISMRPL